MDFREIPVTDIIPQREPFVMISRLVYDDPVKSCTELEVTDGNIFVSGGRLSPYGIMENVAQTCAARIGYYCKYILKKDIRIGYIGAIRNFTVFDTPKTGETIRTSIEVREEIFNVSMIEAEVRSGDRTIARGIMKIALSGDET